MNRPTFFEGVGVAAATSAVAAIGFGALLTILPGALALRALVVAVGFVYVGYLLARSPVRIGRVTAAAAWACATAAAVLADLSLTGHILVQLAAVWLVRSLYFHASVLAALADLGLCAFGLAAATWAAAQSASVFLSVWCLLLVQALFVTVPPGLPRRGRGHGAGAPAEDRFERAHRTADAALRRLSTVR